MYSNQLPIEENWGDTRLWSTGSVRPQRQFDHWCDFVNRAHSRWDIQRQDFDQFPAFIREGRFEQFRLVNLTSAQGNIKGVRGSREIAIDDEALYNILFIEKGSECLIISGDEVFLNAGDIVVWDNTRPMTFITGKSLHQITLAVTHERLQHVFPAINEFIGVPFSTQSGVNRLFADHLQSLDAEFGKLTSQQARYVLDSTLRLLSSALENNAGDFETDQRSIQLFSSICLYIDGNLDDLDLSISAIADHFSVSVRHLHRLFHKSEMTVAKYILMQRLMRCKQELESPSYKSTTITEIALKWGFNDSSTFSKTFRRVYGVSPREYRKTSTGAPDPVVR